jgi:hypothetical protein
MKKVMDEIISINQTAFVQGRFILDGVTGINEVIDYAKRKKKKCFVFKVDFEKAYDSVDWKFLDYMLRRFGFEDKWRNWIRACVFGGNLSVLVNGCPSNEMNIARGLKQGDPLAPFLFLLVAEGLGGLMKAAVASGLFGGVVVENQMQQVSRLQYADDSVFIGEACFENIWTLKAILRHYELISGLKVNFFKSSLLGINVEESFLEGAATFLNCKIGSLPMKYLGIPIGANPRKHDT